MLCFSVDTVRQIEKKAISHGILEETLMQRAAQAVLQHCEDQASLLIICGPGNNGGDGYRLAYLAKQQDMTVTVVMASPGEKLVGAARDAFNDCINIGIDLVPASEFDAVDNDIEIVVDAIFGIGLSRNITDPDIVKCIEVMNKSDAFVIAIDTPTGVNADTGHVFEPAVIADLTVTMIAMKRGLLTGLAPNYCGEVVEADLELTTGDDVAYKFIEVLDKDLLEEVPARLPASHKGDFGKLLIIGGDNGMAGAVRIAAEAALRTGAGKVTVMTREKHQFVVNSSRPECLVFGVESADDDYLACVAQHDVIVVGPGLGQSAWSKSLWNGLKKCQIPMVVDASALRLLAEDPYGNPNWLLTPHPGEAAALLNQSTNHISRDRFAAARALQKTYQGMVVLKGFGTIIQSQEDTALMVEGNPGMASAGMGDVLAGILGALVAQGVPLETSACLGAFIHGMAGDMAAKDEGEIGLLASDLFPMIRQLMNSQFDE